MNYCTHDCREGRACSCAPLYQGDGGHYYREGLAWPIEDEPLITPDAEADRFIRVACCVLAFLALACMGGAALL